MPLRSGHITRTVEAYMNILEEAVQELQKTAKGHGEQFDQMDQRFDKLQIQFAQMIDLMKANNKQRDESASNDKKMVKSVFTPS